jgi:energy-coupling factor transporter ATP-binding protein EcfA2
MSAIKRVGDEAEPGSSKKRNKSIKFKPPSPAEHFYCDLFKSCNADVKERQERQNKIADFSLTAYDDAPSYYRNIREIAMEEAYESIQIALRNKKDTSRYSNRKMTMTATIGEIQVQLSLCQDTEGALINGKMMIIRFSTTSNPAIDLSHQSQDHFKPGTVFTLQNSNDIGVGVGDVLGSQILGTVAQTTDSDDDEEEEEKGDPPEKKIARKDDGRIIRRIWIHPAHSKFLLEDVAGGRYQQQVYIFSLETVISHQRIVLTSFDKPSPPFLEQLLKEKDPANMTSSLSLPGEKSQLYDSTELNTSQKEALDDCIDAICSDCGNLKLIQGPPGCGKTHFLAHLVMALIQNKKRVLICASSNKAVCVALEKCLSLQDQKEVPYNVDNVDEMFRPSCGMFALIGESSMIFTHSKDKVTNVNVDADWNYVTKPIMMPSSASHVLVSSYVTRISSTFLAFANSLTMPIIESEVLFKQYYSELVKLFDVINIYSDEIFMKYIDPYHKTLSKLRNIIIEFKEARQRMTLSDIRKFTLRKGLILEDLRKFLDDFYKEERERKKMIENVLKENDDADKFKEVTQRKKMSENVWKEFITSFSSSLRHLANKFETTEEIELIFPRDCIQNANAVFCTLTYTAHNLVKSNLNNVDVLIVDEAGQASEGEIIVPFACNPLNLILIGDPKQLPPTVISEYLKNKNLGGTSTMERLMIVEGKEARLLNTQYRMHSSIAAFSNSRFYGNRIENGSENDKRIDPCLALYKRRLRERFYFIDTTSEFGSQQETRKGKGTSLRNLCEASFITRFVDFIYICLVIYEKKKSVNKYLYYCLGF